MINLQLKYNVNFNQKLINNLINLELKIHKKYKDYKN